MDSMKIVFNIISTNYWKLETKYSKIVKLETNPPGNKEHVTQNEK